MVRPSLPRFLRVGDSFEASAIVDSMAKTPMNVKVSMRTSGVLASGPSSLALTLPPEGHVPVHFTVDAPAVGKGTVTFHVESAQPRLVDDVTMDLDVSTPATLESIVLSGDTHARIDEPLGDLSRARGDVGGFEYRLSSTPIVGLSDSMSGLIEYPYGCTEQLTSRLVPLVQLRTMAHDLGVALPSDVDGAVRSAVMSLLSHQREDGGFGFWAGSRKSEPWLTITAVGALLDVRAAGYVVPDEPIERATKYLSAVEGLDPAERVLLEEHLARTGHPREKELRALAADLGALPLFARGLLAHALAKVDRDLARKVLVSAASHARVTGAAAVVPDEASMSARRYLSSDTRTTAIMLRAFVAIDPQDPLVPKLVRGLLSLRRDGRWPTTQACAWALLALNEARAVFAPPGTRTTAHVLFDGEEVVKAVVGGAETRSGTIPMSRLVAAGGASLSFTTDGAAPLFYEGALRYARKDPPRTPLDHGIHVERTMRVLQRNGDPIAATDLRVGDYIEVDVLLESPVARDLVVLDDPLPAGLLAVNQSFANSDRGVIRSDPGRSFVTHRELRDDRVVTFFDDLPAGAHHTSYVLRVTSAGRFVLPAAKAECMYAPDVFGRTAASIVTAKP